MAKIDLKNQKTEDLVKKMNEAASELQKTRFTVAGTKGLKSNPAELRKIIARVKTELRARTA